jgi:hypothetical protein
MLMLEKVLVATMPVVCVLQPMGLLRASVALAESVGVQLHPFTSTQSASEVQGDKYQ